MNFNKLKQTYIVAEIGVNHEGNINLAKKMIDLAHKSGVNAVKFQTYKHHQYISSSQPERLERVKRFELNYDEFVQIAKYATKRNIDFFSTPLHENDIDFLKKIVKIIKISSGDLTHHKLLEKAAKTKLPIILSTGMASEKEIKEAVKTLKKNHPKIISSGKLMLLHCVALYPTSKYEINLKNIEYLRKKFNLPIGFSDHTIGIKASMLAVALGATVIEKHFTYRIEKQKFHDHKISADFKMMKNLVYEIRDIEIYLGKEKRKVSNEENLNKTYLRRSYCASRFLQKGQIIKEKDLILLRPAWGYTSSQKTKLLNKKLKKDINQGIIIMPKDLI